MDFTSANLVLHGAVPGGDLPAKLVPAAIPALALGFSLAAGGAPPSIEASSPGASGPLSPSAPGLPAPSSGFAAAGSAAALGLALCAGSLNTATKPQMPEMPQVQSMMPGNHVKAPEVSCCSSVACACGCRKARSAFTSASAPPSCSSSSESSTATGSWVFDKCNQAESF